VTLTAAGKDVFGPLQRLLNDAQNIVEHARDLTLHGRDAELHATPLFQDRLVVFTPPGHPLAEKHSVTIREAFSPRIDLAGAR
jgi:DNA-binding transcriptional LysR family regulator